MDFSVISESDIDPGYRSINAFGILCNRYPSAGVNLENLENYPAIENSLDARH